MDATAPGQHADGNAAGLDGPAYLAAACQSSAATTNLSAAADMNLASLLSASYYHAAPERPPRKEQRSSHFQAPLPLYGGLEFASPYNSHLDENRRAGPDTGPLTAQKSCKRQHDGGEMTAARSTAKKPGRPPKTAESLNGEDPEERRRRQLRVAQRAYRSRKESYVSSLTDRISQLESAVDKMSAAIISFSDELVRSEVLTPHADLTGSLRETIQTCLLLATASSNEEDDAQEVRHLSPTAEQLPTTMEAQPQEHAPSPVQPNGPPLPPFDMDLCLLNDPCPPGSPPSRSLAAPLMEYSVFMDRLHMAIVYHGYSALADPSTPVERLRRHFRLLFTVMDRGRMTSFFAAALHAKVSRKRLDEEWNEVPFFHLGGAGSHYAWSATEEPSTALYPRKSPNWRTVLVPLSLFSADVQEELGGDWFDMQDLECYLREKNINLLVPPPTTSDEAKSNAQGWINVSRFISALLNKSTCLGRTPGFRRCDVDMALRTAIWK